MANELRASVLESPIGLIVVAGDDAGLRAVEFSDAGEPPGAVEGLAGRLGRAIVIRDGGVAAAGAAELREYFAGVRREFSVPLAPEGTEFQKRVWDALVAIPLGRTRSYGEIAREVADMSAVRVVGAANGANPIAIMIPCHRVVASDGTLHGYAGGLHRKGWLLDHERAMAGDSLFAGQGRGA